MNDSIPYLRHNNHYCNATVVVVIITIIRSDCTHSGGGGDDSFPNDMSSQLLDTSTLSHTHVHLP